MNSSIRAAMAASPTDMIEVEATIPTSPDSASQHRKFTFDTVFDAGGQIVSAPAPAARRSFSAAEAEAMRQDAYLAGQQSETARAQVTQALALQALSDLARQGIEQLQEAVMAHKRTAVILALKGAEKIAAEALNRFPEAPLTAALEALEAEISDHPRLVISLPGVEEAVKAAAEQALSLTGFAGSLVFRDGHAGAKGSFEIGWSDGRAVFDPDRTAELIASLLAEALNAEIHHRHLDDAGDLSGGVSGDPSQPTEL